MDINIFPFGGQDENGKNSFGIEVDKDIFLVNAGIQVPINNRNGIDGIIPEYEYLKGKEQKIKGLFVTHAHDENFAAIPWLLMEQKGIKIFGSRFTLSIIKNRISKYGISSNDYKLIEINKPLNFGNVVVKPYQVANSIPGSLAYVFETKDGSIVFMSNYVNDKLGVFGNTDLEQIKNENPNILALVHDSRIANYNGSSAKEKSVKPKLIEEFKNAKSDERIIVGAYDEEMYTLQEIMDLAYDFKRPVIPYGRAFDELYQMLLAEKSDIKKPLIEDYQKLDRFNNAVILVTGNWARLYSRFVRIATNNDVYLKLKPSDHIIMVAPPINGLEVEYAMTLDDIAKVSPNIVDITDTDFYKLRPAKQDISKAVSILKPKYFLPMSALYRYMVVASKEAIKNGVTQDRNIILQNGKVAWFKDGNLASQKGRISHAGDVIIDGFGVGDISLEVIKERQSLAANGLVSIASLINYQERKVVGKPNIQLVGVASKTQLTELQEHVNTIIVQKLQEMKDSDIKELQNGIRKKIRKVFFKLLNKEPLVVITFVKA